MRKVVNFVAAVAGLAIPSIALAGANKTWVSGSGADSGTCQFAAPCRSFQYALTQTNAGGEIDVKDSGGYGTVVIDKAISIVAADGVLATISVPAGGIGISVLTGITNLVALRGLVVDGHLLGGNGIVLGSPTSITKVELRNLSRAVTVNGTYSYIKDGNIASNNFGILINQGDLWVDNDAFNDNNYAINNGRDANVYTFNNNSFVHNNYNNTLPLASYAKN